MTKDDPPVGMSVGIGPVCCMCVGAASMLHLALYLLAVAVALPCR